MTLNEEYPTMHNFIASCKEIVNRTNDIYSIPIIIKILGNETQLDNNSKDFTNKQFIGFFQVITLFENEHSIVNINDEIEHIYQNKNDPKTYLEKLRTELQEYFNSIKKFTSVGFIPHIHKIQYFQNTQTNRNGNFKDRQANIMTNHYFTLQEHLLFIKEKIKDVLIVFDGYLQVKATAEHQPASTATDKVAEVKKQPSEKSLNVYRKKLSTIQYEVEKVWNREINRTEQNFNKLYLTKRKEYCNDHQIALSQLNRELKIIDAENTIKANFIRHYGQFV